MYPGQSLLSLKYKWVRVVLYIFIFFISLFILYIYTFFITPSKDYAIQKNANSVLFLYPPFLTNFNRSSAQNIKTSFENINYNVNFSSYNLNSSASWNNYSFVILEIPKYFKNKNSLLTIYLNSLKNTQVPVSVIVEGNKDIFFETYIKKLLTGKGSMDVFFYYTFEQEDPLKLVLIDHKNYLKTVDTTNITRLNQIVEQINAYYKKNNTLPRNFNGLNVSSSILDNVYTHKPFEYTIRADIYYKLCTDFFYNFKEEGDQYKNYTHNEGYGCYYNNIQQNEFPQNQISIIENIRNTENNNLTGKINTYYNKNFKIPKTLDILQTYYPGTSILDPQTNKEYNYATINDTDYTLCKDSAGNDCVNLRAINNANVISKNTLENTSFESWSNYLGLNVISGWNVSNTNTGIVEKSQNEKTENDMYSLEISGKGYANSNYFEVTPNTKYKLTANVKTESTCNSCGYLGIQIFNSTHTNISKLERSCGYYSSDKDIVYSYINPSLISGVYNEYSMVCTLPKDATFVKVFIGTIDGIGTKWYFDNLKFYIP
ncbi:hypothetical protein COV24_02655 [candidate division WWE3 bacterium CG10_big_fil_rev_8_21_14_0_10_32_10]|uniref:Uncharacterized protein n=1 Tax=candidate division WWE3 bacterium CG10_big_fil_rev_8_21_14_0_10_32_10 TaxID=1975090 RepID=A0A2H0RAC0_UNCKA|nr:MAG: hypothetical protein COV24_02655 [candidate division WWE3 bacterium CG10_big_fil_rev_8_21_14_0_10_32_10]